MKLLLASGAAALILGLGLWTLLPFDPGAPAPQGAAQPAVPGARPVPKRRGAPGARAAAPRPSPAAPSAVEAARAPPPAPTGTSTVPHPVTGALAAPTGVPGEPVPATLLRARVKTILDASKTEPRTELAVAELLGAGLIRHHGFSETAKVRGLDGKLLGVRDTLEGPFEAKGRASWEVEVEVVDEGRVERVKLQLRATLEGSTDPPSEAPPEVPPPPP